MLAEYYLDKNPGSTMTLSADTDNTGVAEFDRLTISSNDDHILHVTYSFATAGVCTGGCTRSVDVDLPAQLT